MRTSDAIYAGFICPKCNDVLCNDKAGKGFVRHKCKGDCDQGRGEKDPPKKDETAGLILNTINEYINNPITAHLAMQQHKEDIEESNRHIDKILLEAYEERAEKYREILSSHNST